MTLRRENAAALVLIAFGMLQQPGAIAQTAQDPSADDDAPSRYALEFIVFRYDESVSAGTEVFLPDLPEPEPIPDVEDDVPPLSGLPDTLDPGLPDTLDNERQEFASFANAETADVDSAASDAPAFGDDRMLSETMLDEPVEILPFGEADFAVTELDAFRTRDAIDLRLIPQDALSMTDVHERLLLLDAYEPVLWSGWTQIVVEQDRSLAIDLRRLGAPPDDIDGTLTLYLGRFVHLVADLTWSIPESGTGFGEVIDAAPSTDVPYFGDGAADSDYFGMRADPNTVYVRYSIAEDRIMRNGDTRYFDHPRFGLIARLTLVEPGSALDPTPAIDDMAVPVEGATGNPAVLPADDSGVLQPATLPQ